MYISERIEGRVEAKEFKSINSIKLKTIHSLGELFQRSAMLKTDLNFFVFINT